MVKEALVTCALNGLLVPHSCTAEQSMACGRRAPATWVVIRKGSCEGRSGKGRNQPEPRLQAESQADRSQGGVRMVVTDTEAYSLKAFVSMLRMVMGFFLGDENVLN